MSATRKDAVETADDLAKRTARTVSDAARDTTIGLDFDSEPQTFLVMLETLADDPIEGPADQDGDARP